MGQIHLADAVCTPHVLSDLAAVRATLRADVPHALVDPLPVNLQIVRLVEYFVTLRAWHLLPHLVHRHHVAVQVFQPLAALATLLLLVGVSASVMPSHDSWAPESLLATFKITFKLCPSSFAFFSVNYFYMVVETFNTLSTYGARDLWLFWAMLGSHVKIFGTF